MKKIIFLTIGLLGSLLFFTACGSSSSSKNSFSPENSNSDVNQSNNEGKAPEEERESNSSTVTTDMNALLVLAKKEPYYPYLWHIDSSKSILPAKGYSVNKNADINLLEAWKLTMGEGVVVAVIDDGGEVEHEDLKANVLLAYNADDKSSNILPPEGEYSHGNTCAGFIVAPINGKGMVGIAPKSKLIVIRQELESDANVIHAFEYAKKNGAKVISCSWGTKNVSDVVVAELKSLYDSGITVLFASGNKGISLDEEGVNDESEVEWVIGVGASTENNDVGSYSNYGKNLEVIAPGGDTEESSGLLGIDNMKENGQTRQLELVNTNYSFTNGTSFSTPITAGVVALMYAVNPKITPSQIQEILIKTSEKVGIEIDASYDAKGFDLKRAYGKIDAGKAVIEAKKILK